MPEKVRAIPEGFHTLTPHITVRDAAGAIEFYKKALNAQVLHVSHTPNGKVMHASLKIGETRVMASDGRNTGNPKFDGFALSVDAKDAADADRLFKGLSDGGTIIMPLDKTFFSPRFGMTQDKFGVNWMVIVEPK